MPTKLKLRYVFLCELYPRQLKSPYPFLSLALNLSYVPHDKALTREENNQTLTKGEKKLGLVNS